MNLDDMARQLPAERDLPAARKQILKEHLMTELRQADGRSDPTRPRTRRPHRRTVLVAGAVLTAAAVAIATLVVGDETIYRSQMETRLESPAHRHQFALPFIAGLSYDAARLVFFVFLVLFVVALVAGRRLPGDVT